MKHTFLLFLSLMVIILPATAQTSVDWKTFLAQHDMCWTTLTADPTQKSADGGIRTGYYAGAIMGNGLIGTNLYKLKDNVYRLNVGRSDVTEIRKPYNLYNSSRLPIGYFTLQTVGNVTSEKMRLSIYDAITSGTFTTNKGKIQFSTYVHAVHDYIIFESNATGAEADYQWDFVPLQAVSTRQIFQGGAPEGYLNCQGKSNPDPTLRTEDGIHLLIQPLVTDTTFQTVGRVYVVAWKDIREGSKRRIIATVSQASSEASAISAAKQTISAAFASPVASLEKEHKAWWNTFYQKAAFLSFPDTRMETFYWDQYYKFASTARPGKPIVDLQGVWPSWDTPWTAIWMNLNIQLTYSWQTKANLRDLTQPLWDALYEHRNNLRRNVTDIPSQSTWTDAACLPRTATYDFLSPLDPATTVNKNQYEVGNLTWLLYYYWQQCVAYGDTLQLTERLYPLLKSAINLYFHIRVKDKDGHYSLPPTASPEYTNSNIGTNTNYDLSNLRWGLKTLIDIATEYHIQDPMLSQWKDFQDHLVDYPYSVLSGFKISDLYYFENSSHRHFSHLFMIYPYHLLDWDNAADHKKMQLSLNHWNGNQGYSRTAKAAMLLSNGDGDGALSQMQAFFSTFIKPNTLYAETGPVIETPFAAVSTLHEFYMQDWGNKIRIFYGLPTSWTEASFINMRARGAFLISATRNAGHTVFIQVESEKGNHLHLQTGIPSGNIRVRNLQGRDVPFSITDTNYGVIELNTKPGQVLQVTDKTHQVVLPHPLPHPASEANYYGDGLHQATH